MGLKEPHRHAYQWSKVHKFTIHIHDYRVRDGQHIYHTEVKL